MNTDFKIGRRFCAGIHGVMWVIVKLDLDHERFTANNDKMEGAVFSTKNFNKYYNFLPDLPIGLGNNKEAICV